MPNYEPSDDDIVRARLRTLGVEEHRFTMESGAYPGSEWYIYDVGGSRSVVSLHIFSIQPEQQPITHNTSKPIHPLASPLDPLL